MTTTIITPKKEDFSHQGFASIKELEDIISDFDEKLEYAWDGITALAYATPRDLAETLENFNGLWNKFKNTYMSKFYLSKILELWGEEQNKKELLSNCTDVEKEEYSPTLQWECFAFGDCPNLGIDISRENIKKIKNRLIGLCSSTPKDLTTDSSCDIEKYLSTVLSNLRAVLENYLKEFLFSLLCVKYKDTLKYEYTEDIIS